MLTSPSWALRRVGEETQCLHVFPLDRLTPFPSSLSLSPSSCPLSGYMGDVSAGTLGNRSNNATFVAQ